MLIRLLKHTWFFRGFDKLRNLVVATLARIETRQANDTAVLTRIEHRLAALDSLSANHAAIREGLLHLLQRAPADNALAEARQAALLREIRERVEVKGNPLIELTRRPERAAVQDDHLASLTRIFAAEPSVPTRLEGLVRRIDECLDLVKRRFEELDARLALRDVGLQRAHSADGDHLAKQTYPAYTVLSRVEALESAINLRLDDTQMRLVGLERAFEARLDGLEVAVTSLHHSSLHHSVATPPEVGTFAAHVPGPTEKRQPARTIRDSETSLENGLNGTKVGETAG